MIIVVEKQKKLNQWQRYIKKLERREGESGRIEIQIEIGIGIGIGMEKGTGIDNIIDRYFFF